MLSIPQLVLLFEGKCLDRLYKRETIQHQLRQSSMAEPIKLTTFMCPNMGPSVDT
jgi:hypothetical protein